ncbi:hypothetical protein IGI37_002641 [Enterococcus sp. AZ194]|uniref:ABC transporter ATP-binding protein n=1 Tax=Enterococcus sp. AZ194 TaxID=2774629 RepID=UPI003F204201
MLTATNLSYRYNYTEVLQNVNLSFEAGKMYAIVGKSGSGKTTLLSLLSGISTLQEGNIQFQGQSLTTGQLAAYRKKISIVFQSYNLINYLSPLQNVLLALDINRKKGNKKQLATSYLNKVGLSGDQLTRPCKELSGGQQQRVAIARAIACDSEIIFADEPTGNLDVKTGQEIITLLRSIAEVEKKCIICVTHDLQLEEYADATYRISDGKIVA